MKNRWKTNRHSVYNIGFHIIWATKYRRKVLTEEIQLRLKNIIIEKSNLIDTEIVSIEIMPDHVHIFVKTEPINSVHYIVQQFKGYSSNILRKEFASLKRMPTLWTRSYYTESVGFVNEDNIKKYIENQKSR